jgi:hypothetical protein
MSVLTSSSPAATGAGSDAAGLAVLTFLTLLVLLFEKAVATNVSAPGFRRLSRCLDVGIVPLGLGSLVIAATQLAGNLGQGF